MTFIWNRFGNESLKFTLCLFLVSDDLRRNANGHEDATDDKVSVNYYFHQTCVRAPP